MVYKIVYSIYKLKIKLSWHSSQKDKTEKIMKSVITMKTEKKDSNPPEQK